VYVVLYSCVTQLLGGVLVAPGWSLPTFGHVWPLRAITEWLAALLPGEPTVFVPGNSGDTLFHWVQLTWLTAVAVLLTIAWAWSQRPRIADDTLHDWVRLVLRFVLAGQLFYYGMAKVVPSQFQAPSLVTLVQPVGSLSLADLLWTFIGASPSYQLAAGVAEVAAGALLVIPHTAALGALVSLFDMVQVFALNMAYDFGLKQLSWHLAAFSALLLVPERQWVVAWVGRGTPAGALHVERIPGVTSARGQRRAVAAQIVLGVYLLGVFTNLSLHFWRTQGDGRPRAPLYGIWDVSGLWVDGVEVPPATADYDRRWRRVIFDALDVVAFQRLDDSIAHYGSAWFETEGRLVLSKGRSRTWRATFTFARRNADQVQLVGDMDGRMVRLDLERVGLDTFRLRGSRFRWVRPPDPFAG
jgi:uncharacterized membrane protein YphA (DoxX/SURF4 family)